MADKEWSENPEDDPVELQKRQLALGKEFLDRLKKQEAAEEERRKKYENPTALADAMRPYSPPSFEEVSAVLKKAWDEVERIMPTAGDKAKAMAFQSLTHAAAPRPTFGE